jgi:hypothetical protein
MLTMSPASRTRESRSAGAVERLHFKRGTRSRIAV